MTAEDELLEIVLQAASAKVTLTAADQLERELLGRITDLRLNLRKPNNQGPFIQRAGSRKLAALVEQHRTALRDLRRATTDRDRAYMAIHGWLDA